VLHLQRCSIGATLFPALAHRAIIDRAYGTEEW